MIDRTIRPSPGEIRLPVADLPRGLRHVAARGKLTATPPKADDALPVAEWAEAVGKRMDAVCEATGQKKQAVKLEVEQTALF